MRCFNRCETIRHRLFIPDVSFLPSSVLALRTDDASAEGARALCGEIDDASKEFCTMAVDHLAHEDDRGLGGYL